MTPTKTQIRNLPKWPDDYPDFMHGDGRKKVRPLIFLYGHPEAVTRGTARWLWNSFIILGCSRHSPVGATLWVVLEGCISLKLPHELTVVPDFGYEVRLIKHPMEV